LSFVLKYSKIRTNTSSGKFRILLLVTDHIRSLVVDRQEIPASGSSSRSQIIFHPTLLSPKITRLR
jgi:hypothetical protein